MTSGNAPAAGCSHNRGRRAATLMIACGRADERSPTAVNRIIVPQVKGDPSGQGRGRTADLPLFREQSYHVLTRQDAAKWPDLGAYRA